MENLDSFLTQYLSHPYLVVFIFVWSAFWKAMALWTAAGKKQVTWFILLFLVNTMGILEILYLFSLNRFSLGSEKVLSFLKEKFGKIKK